MNSIGNPEMIERKREAAASPVPDVNTRVKVCGVTNEADALLCVEAGAHLLGFNFYAGSPRYIKPSAARRVIERIKRRAASTQCVGVFVDEELETVRRVAGETGLDAVQLHGDESPQYCRALGSLEVIKALRVDQTYQPHSAALYECESVLLDAWQADLRGGTGRTFDWSLARATRACVARLLLAGGLTPENVGDAVRIVRPFAVDVCSGVESAPGRKDMARVRLFIKAVREADAANGVEV